MNSLSECWVRSIKFECLSKTILFGKTSLRRALINFTDHYQVEHPRQGLGNELIHAPEPQPEADEVVVDQRLGGRLKNDHRVAA